MSTVCGRPQGKRGVRPMWTHVERGRGVKNVVFCGRHKWMAPRGANRDMWRNQMQPHTDTDLDYDRDLDPEFDIDSKFDLDPEFYLDLKIDLGPKIDLDLEFYLNPELDLD